MEGEPEPGPKSRRKCALCKNQNKHFNVCSQCNNHVCKQHSKFICDTCRK